MEKSQKNGFGIAGIIIIIAAVAILGGGFLYLNELKRLKNLTIPPPAPAPQNQPVQQPAPPAPSAELDTSTWKTYRNEQYGFEVRYPQPESPTRKPIPPVESLQDSFSDKNFRFGVLLRDVGTDWANTLNLSINIYEESADNRLQSTLQTFERVGYPVTESPKPTIIVGQDGIQVSADYGEGGKVRHIFWQKNRFTYETFYGTEDYGFGKELIPKILSTFKFF